MKKGTILLILWLCCAFVDAATISCSTLLNQQNFTVTQECNLDSDISAENAILQAMVVQDTTTTFTVIISKNLFVDVAGGFSGFHSGGTLIVGPSGVRADTVIINGDMFGLSAINIFASTIEIGASSQISVLSLSPGAGPGFLVGGYAGGGAHGGTGGVFGAPENPNGLAYGNYLAPVTPGSFGGKLSGAVNDICGLCGDNFCGESEVCHNCIADCGPCKVVCKNDCSSHGACVAGNCVCTPPWTGPYCESQNQPIQTSVNITNPNVVVSERSTSFSISIRKIVEKDFKNADLRSIAVSQVNFTTKAITILGKNRISNYSTTIQNGAILTVTVYEFEEPQTAFTFAGTKSSFPQHTVKFTIRIQNWPFLSLANSLHIVFDASGRSSAGTVCADESQALRWILVVVDGVALYAQFLDKSVVDGKVRTVSYSQNITDNSISAILPHFWDYLELDPSYSVLVGVQPDKYGTCATTTKSTKTNSKVIIIAITVSVVGAFLIAAIALGFYKHHTRKSTMTKLRSSPSSVQMDRH